MVETEPNEPAEEPSPCRSVFRRREANGVQQKAEGWGILPWGYDDIVWIDDIVDDIIDDTWWRTTHGSQVG